MVQLQANGETRQEILRAALKRFAHGGYAATSVQQIVSDAKVSKPTLYYYFADKAELFQALVHEAHDERYRLLREAAARAGKMRGATGGHSHRAVRLLPREPRADADLAGHDVRRARRSAGRALQWRALRAQL